MKTTAFIIRSIVRKKSCFIYTSLHLVRFEVFKMTNMKMAVLWYVASCSLVDIDWCSRRVYCLCGGRQGNEWPRWWKQLAALKHQPVSARLCGAAYQKTYIIVCFAFVHQNIHPLISWTFVWVVLSIFHRRYSSINSVQNCTLSLNSIFTDLLL